MVGKINLYNFFWERIIKSSSIDQEVSSSYNKVFIIILILFFFPDSIWLSELPNALYNPPKLSIAVFFSGFPNYTILLISHILLVLSLILIGIDKFKVGLGILSFILIIFISNFRYGFGKIDHEILLPITLLCFSLGNWKCDKENINHFLPIPPETLLALFISFGMFTAGIQKLFSWIDFDTQYSGFLYWFNSGYYNLGRTNFLAPLVLKMPPLIIELFDYLAVIFELSPLFILTLGKKIYWKLWIVSACFFHFNTLLLLNINFTTHILVYLPYIIPLSLIHFFKKNTTPHGVNISIIIIGSFQILSLILANKSLLNFLIADKKLNLYFALILWFLIILVGIYSMVTNSKKESSNKSNFIIKNPI